MSGKRPFYHHKSRSIQSRNKAHISPHPEWEHHREKSLQTQLGSEKLPLVSDLTTTYDRMLKKAAHSRYKEVRRKMGDLLIAKQNVNLLLVGDCKRTIEHEQIR